MGPPVFGHRGPVAATAEGRLLGEKRRTEHGHVVTPIGTSHFGACELKLAQAGPAPSQPAYAGPNCPWHYETSCDPILHASLAVLTLCPGDDGVAADGHGQPKPSPCRGSEAATFLTWPQFSAPPASRPKTQVASMIGIGHDVFKGQERVGVPATCLPATTAADAAHASGRQWQAQP